MDGARSRYNKASKTTKTTRTTKTHRVTQKGTLSTYKNATVSKVTTFNAQPPSFMVTDFGVDDYQSPRAPNTRILRELRNIKQRINEAVSNYEDSCCEHPSLLPEEMKFRQDEVEQMLKTYDGLFKEKQEMLTELNDSFRDQLLILGDGELDLDIKKLLADIPQELLEDIAAHNFEHYMEQAHDSATRAASKLQRVLGSMDPEKHAKLVEYLQKKQVRRSPTPAASRTIPKDSTPLPEIAPDLNSSKISAHDIEEDPVREEQLLVDDHQQPAQQLLLSLAKVLKSNLGLQELQKELRKYPLNADVTEIVNSLLVEEFSRRAHDKGNHVTLVKQVQKTVEAMRCYLAYMDKARKSLNLSSLVEGTKGDAALTKMAEKLTNMYIGYYTELSDRSTSEAYSKQRDDVQQLESILEVYNPIANPLIKEVEKGVDRVMFCEVIDTCIQGARRIRSALSVYFNRDAEWVDESTSEIVAILENRVGEVLKNMPTTNEDEKLQHAREIKKQLRNVTRELINVITSLLELDSASTDKGDLNEALTNFTEWCKAVDPNGKECSAALDQELHKQVIAFTEKIGLKIPSDDVCKQLLKMGGASWWKENISRAEMKRESCSPLLRSVKSTRRLTQASVSSVQDRKPLRTDVARKVSTVGPLSRPTPRVNIVHMNSLFEEEEDCSDLGEVSLQQRFEPPKIAAYHGAFYNTHLKKKIPLLNLLAPPSKFIEQTELRTSDNSTKSYGSSNSSSSGDSTKSKTYSVHTMHQEFHTVESDRRITSFSGSLNNSYPPSVKNTYQRFKKLGEEPQQHSESSNNSDVKNANQRLKKLSTGEEPQCAMSGAREWVTNLLPQVTGESAAGDINHNKPVVPSKRNIGHSTSFKLPALHREPPPSLSTQKRFSLDRSKLADTFKLPRLD